MKDIAPKWRLLVLRNVFAQAEDSSFINEIDLFVHHMGPSSHPTVKELLMNEKFKNKTVIANKSGSILCAFAQRTRIKRLVQDEKIVEVVQCSICENTFLTKSHMKNHMESIHEGKKSHATSATQILYNNAV